MFFVFAKRHQAASHQAAATNVVFCKVLWKNQFHIYIINIPLSFGMSICALGQYIVDSKEG